MAGTLAWIAIVVAGAGWELCCRLDRRGRRPRLGAVLGRLQAGWPGRAVLLAVWAFAGFHLFARYTIA